MTTTARARSGGTKSHIRYVGAAFAFAFASIASAEPPTDASRYFWDSRPDRCFGKDAPPATGSCTANADWPTYQKSITRLYQLIDEGSPQQIRRAQREVGNSNERFRTGEYRFDAWYQALKIAYVDYMAEPTLAKWAETDSPDSQIAVGQALVHVGKAWKARGHGSARTVSAEGWKLFHAHLDDANVALQAAPPAVKKGGPWQLTHLVIDNYRDIDATTKQQDFESAIALWPDFLRLYQVQMEFHGPMWRGDYAQMDDIAHDAVKRSEKTYGAGAYPSLYALVRRNDSSAAAGGEGIDLKLMRKGFEDMQRRYPDDDGRRSLTFAELACAIRDEEWSAKLYTQGLKLSGQAMPDLSTDPCLTFAFGKDKK